MANKKVQKSTLDEYLPESYKDPRPKGKRSRRRVKTSSEENDSGCKICGNPIEDLTFKRCRKCLNKLALIDDLKELLEYISPGESFRESDLTNKGFKSLKLNLLINKFLKEQLILINLDGLFILNDMKFLNEFISKYGEREPLIKEEDHVKDDLEEDVSGSKDSLYIDIADYSDYVGIRFNPRIDKWVVDFYSNKDLLHSKSFPDPEEANKEAIHYLRQSGVLGNRKKTTEKSGHDKRQFSSHEGIYYSPRRGKWGAKVKGYKGFKFLGHFHTEEEAYNARCKYLEEKERTRQKFISEKRGLKTHKMSDSSGEGIYFSRQKGQWIVRLKNDEGKYVNVGQFDSEEEALKAKEEFLSENV